MTAPTPVGFLDFFILEASDYVEQLDAQLLAGSTSLPDGEAMQRVARALRGSATMAKLPSFAEMAAGIERVGRALREGALQWEPALRGALVAAVDDAKILLRNVRAWSDADEQRARTRITELTSYAPTRVATPLNAPSVQTHDSYLATESSNIGAGLELLATRPNDRDAATNVLRRVRALRGIASVKDRPALADVLEAAEQAAHPLELGEPTIGSERVAVLGAAATVLRGIAQSIRTGRAGDQDAQDIARFTAALEAMQERETGSERIVPIADLFYQDGGPTVVSASPQPPTTPAERFRLEVVSQGEHLRRVIADARAAKDDLSRDRARRELRQALRSLRQSAESFAERDVAAFVASHNDSAVHLDPQSLNALDELASLLAHPGDAPAPIAERLATLRTSRAAALTPVAPSPAIAPPTLEPQQRMVPAVQELATAAITTAATAANALGDLLDAGIRNLGALATTPLSAPAVLEEQPPVPIDVLLYRGKSAIMRAREIRDGLRARGGPVDADALGELFDLLDLAVVDG